MVKVILKYLAVLLAGALVFAAARYLDKGPSVPAEVTEAPAATAAMSWTEPAQAAEEATEEAGTGSAEERTLLLTFTGDCTLGCRDSHSYIDFGFTKVVGEDYGYPFRNVVSYFENDDLTLINLEGALTDTGNAQKKTHTFRGPTSYVNFLTENSVEFASIANNHTMDYNQVGYDSTKATLEDAGVSFVERDSSTVITLENGVTVGVYGAVYYLIEEKTVTAAIKALDEQADIVIFAPHWGTEKSYNPLEDQTGLAHAAIDAGADIVWGSHPHVLQPIEEYNGGIIFYSMGNFSFGGNIYPEDYDSALIQQELRLAADGTVTLGETTIVPVCISTRTDRNDYQPVLYEAGSEGYERVLQKLNGTFKK